MKRLCRWLVLGTGLGLMGVLAIPIALLAVPIVGIWAGTDWLLKHLE